MTLLLDTHFLVWALLGHKRLREFPWLERHKPWSVSPVSLLELQFLAEVGKLQARAGELADALAADPRFVLDEVSLLVLVRAALPLGWTRDPFDRLLCAHSYARRLPFCTLDELIRKHHPLIPPELAP